MYYNEALAIFEKANKAKKKPVQHERILQRGIVSKFRKRPDYGLFFTLHHSPNEGDAKPQYRRTLYEMGMEAGQPDLEFYLITPAGPRVVFIELKHGNRLSKAKRLTGAQPERHKTLKALGFEVHTIIEDDPEIGYARICDLLGLDAYAADEEHNPAFLQ